MTEAAAVSGEWLSAGEARRLINVSRSTFYRLVKRGDVPAFRLGGRLRFKRSDVLAAPKPVPSPTSK